MAFTITDGKIVEIDVIGDPDRLRDLDLAVLDVDLEGLNALRSVTRYYAM